MEGLLLSTLQKEERMRCQLILAGVVIAALAADANGMIMDSAGNVTDWGVTPFSQPSPSYTHVGNMWSTIENNYSPINYPGVGRQPSGGETYDLEELHVRFVDDKVQMLLVGSTGLSSPHGSSTFYLGDLMLTVNGQQYGVVTQPASQGLAAGAIYRVNGSGDVVALQFLGGSYAGNTTLVQNDYGPDATVQDVAGPWAVKGTISPTQFIGSAALSFATFNYGGAENGTFLMEYSIDAGLLGLLEPWNLQAQITWGCGNDVIRTSAPNGMPEPCTILLLLGGVAMTYLTRKRRTIRVRK
jgi:hypothetical protein